MSEEQPSFRCVVVGVDGRTGGRDAIALARMLAGAGTRLLLARVYAGAPIEIEAAKLDPAKLSGGSAEAQRVLEEERARAEIAAELVPVGASSVGRGLDGLAESEHADLLVVGSSHRGFLGRVFVGDDTRGALNGAPCAVAVAPLGYAQALGTISTIGVGYDGSSESEAALALARELAREHGASLRALKVVQILSSSYAGFGGVAWGDALETVLADAKRSMTEIPGVQGDAALGVPGEELAAFGDEVDLLLVGSRAYGPVRRLMLGSTSHYLIGHARCPLLVIPRPSA